MKVVLIFPPQWDVTIPYLALPSLTAYLRQHGHEVVQRDLNIETYNLFLGERFLTRIAGRVRERIRALESGGQLEGDQLKEYRELCQADMIADHTLEHIEGSVSAFRRDEDFTFGNVLESREMVSNACHLISAACHPASFTFLSFKPDYYRSGRDIRRAVLDEKQNAFREAFREYFLDSLMAEKADLVGISITAYEQLIPGITLASLIRERDSEVHITIGGFVFTTHLDMLLREKDLFDFFSSVVIHEGELPLLRLVEALEGRRGFETISNFAYLDGDEVRVNPRQETVDLNTLSTPVYDGLPLEDYDLPGSVLPVSSGRGCYWGKCAFCSDVCGADESRNRDMHLVVEDIARLREKHGVTMFFLADSCVHPARLSVFAERLLETGLEVGWMAQTRTESGFTPELCQLLAKSGCHDLFWGVESASDRMLKAMRKGTTRKWVEAALRNSKEAGIRNHIYILVGFPSEEWIDIQETLSFLIDGKDIIGSVEVNEFDLLLNSPAAFNPERYHITSVESDREEIGGSYKYVVDKGLSQEEGRQAKLYLKRELAKIYPPYEVWGRLVPLYDFFTGVAEMSSPEKPPRVEDINNWDRVYLALKESVFRRVLSFDIREDGDGAQRECLGVYNRHDHRFFVMGMAVKGFLDMCQEGMSVGEIATEVSAEHGLPLERVRESYLGLVSTLHQKGLVTLREGGAP